MWRRTLGATLVVALAVAAGGCGEDTASEPAAQPAPTGDQPATQPTDPGSPPAQAEPGS